MRPVSIAAATAVSTRSGLTIKPQLRSRQGAANCDHTNHSARSRNGGLGKEPQLRFWQGAATAVSARSGICGLAKEHPLSQKKKTATRRPRPLLSKCIASSISISIPCTFLYLFLFLPSVNYVVTCVGVRQQRRLPECARFRVLGNTQGTAVCGICRSIRISHRPQPLPLPLSPPLPLPLFCSQIDSANVRSKELRRSESATAVRVVHCGHSRLATEARVATATKEWR